MSLRVLGSLKDPMAKWEVSLFRKNMQGFLVILVAWAVAGSSSSTPNALFLENLKYAAEIKSKNKQTNSSTGNEEVAQSHSSEQELQLHSLQKNPKWTCIPGAGF